MSRKHDLQQASTPGALASNSVKRVREVTRAAFGIYGDQHHLVDAIKKLTELDGVSFPVATLILVEYNPVNIPYFTNACTDGCGKTTQGTGFGIGTSTIPFLISHRKIRGTFKQQNGAESHNTRCGKSRTSNQRASTSEKGFADDRAS